MRKIILFFTIGLNVLPSTGSASESFFQQAEILFNRARPVALENVVKEGPLTGSCVEESSQNYLKSGTLFLDKVGDPVLNEYVSLKYTYKGLLEYYFSQMTNTVSGDLEGSNQSGRGKYRLRLGTNGSGKNFWIFKWVPDAGYIFYCWFNPS